MSETDEARQLREHKAACAICGEGNRLNMCLKGEQLQNASVDKFLKIERRRA